MESDEARARRRRMVYSWSRPTKMVPPIIYYYCSVDTFIKIITNKTLWLTNLFFLNDSRRASLAKG